MTDQPLTLDLTKYIEERHFGSRPHLRGHRVPVALVAYGHNGAGMSIAELMEAYTLSEPEVLAALLYYAEHQAEIDTYEEAYAAASPDDWITHGDDSFLLRRDDVADRGE
jgi:uncharacterized protein (DUF433 family)